MSRANRSTASAMPCANSAKTVIASGSSPTTRRARAPTSPRISAPSASSSTTKSSKTTPRAAARVLAGKRVLALTMSAIRPELEGVQLVGEEAEAVLLGGADETDEPEPRLQLHEPRSRVCGARGAARISTACTRTAGGRRRAARSSIRAHSSRGSSTRPAWRRPCSGNRAPRSSALRSMHSTPTPSGRGWSATISRPTSPARRPWAAHDSRPHGQVPRAGARRGTRQAGRRRRLARGRARLPRTAPRIFIRCGWAST